jgi:hypothetical protein
MRSGGGAASPRRGRWAAKSWNWEHIFERHSEGGAVARQRNDPAQIFGGMSKNAIKSTCERAWNTAIRVEVQRDVERGDHYRFIGRDPQTGMPIGFWYHVPTKTVESAFPITGSTMGQ